MEMQIPRVALPLTDVLWFPRAHQMRSQMQWKLSLWLCAGTRNLQKENTQVDSLFWASVLELTCWYVQLCDEQNMHTLERDVAHIGVFKLLLQVFFWTTVVLILLLCVIGRATGLLNSGGGGGGVHLQTTPKGQSPSCCSNWCHDDKVIMHRQLESCAVQISSHQDKQIELWN